MMIISLQLPLTLFRCLFLFLLMLSVLYHTEARGGGGRGGRGRGRGRSGSRGSVRAKSTTSSGVRGSSSYSLGVRTGTSGLKVGSKTSAISDYGSNGFRKTLSAGGMYQHLKVRAGHPSVIVAATAPIFYDNREYYWSYYAAKQNRTINRSNIICEYVFGTDDGELQQVTFANGTQAKSIYFNCSGMVDCCGMYCCHDIHQYFELLFLLGFVIILLLIALYAKRREPIREKKNNETVPLRSKKIQPKKSQTKQTETLP